LSQAHCANGAANEHGGKENAEFVHQASLKEITSKNPATFAQHMHDSKIAEFPSQGGKKTLGWQL